MRMTQHKPELSTNNHTRLSHEPHLPPCPPAILTSNLAQNYRAPSIIDGAQLRAAGPTTTTLVYAITQRHTIDVHTSPQSDLYVSCRHLLKTQSSLRPRAQLLSPFTRRPSQNHSEDTLSRSTVAYNKRACTADIHHHARAVTPRSPYHLNASTLSGYWPTSSQWTMSESCDLMRR